VSDKNRPRSTARRAGKGFGRLLEKLLGRDGAAKLVDSADALREEFEEGKREHEDRPPRAIPHRDLDSEPDS